MPEKNLSLDFTSFPQPEDLSKQDRELLQKAIEARKNAYAPYSGFSVGASVLMDNGEIITGNNQENAAYPSGICAERVAVWNAISRFPQGNILKVFISASSRNKIVDRPVSPCGSCRQAMAEYETRQEQKIAVYFTGETGEVIRADSVSDLLPFLFDNSLL